MYAEALRRSLTEQGVPTTVMKSLRHTAARIARNDPYSRRVELGKKLGESTQWTVSAGPYSGMKLGRNQWWSAADAASMLLGLYELEVVDELRSYGKEERFLIDVGAGDGYHAIGLLLSGGVNHAYCFEESEKGRHAILGNARLNQVEDKVSIFGRADQRFAERIVKEVGLDLRQALLLVDIEGSEYSVLKVETLKQFHEAAIIVELHERNETERALAAKWLESVSELAQLDFISTGPRDPNGFPQIREWSDDDRWQICSEGRDRLMRWLVIRPDAWTKPIESVRGNSKSS